MKNRYIGLITVTFPDNYKEKCLIIQKQTKGSEHFLTQTKGALTIILKTIPEGHVKVKYRGDFTQEIYKALEKQEKVKIETVKKS